GGIPILAVLPVSPAAPQPTLVGRPLDLLARGSHFADSIKPRPGDRRLQAAGEWPSSHDEKIPTRLDPEAVLRYTRLIPGTKSLRPGVLRRNQPARVGGCWSTSHRICSPDWPSVRRETSRGRPPSRKAGLARTGPVERNVEG